MPKLKDRHLREALAHLDPMEEKVLRMGRGVSLEPGDFLAPKTIEPATAARIMAIEMAARRGRPQRSTIRLRSPSQTH